MKNEIYISVISIRVYKVKNDLAMVLFNKKRNRMKIKDKILSETSEEVKQRVRDTANKLVMKQETLEEAAEKLYPIDCSNWYIKIPLKEIKAFIQGAKWQQERSYSEEEVLAMLLIKHDGLTPEYVLEQFKKK